MTGTEERLALTVVLVRVSTGLTDACTIDDYHLGWSGRKAGFIGEALSEHAPCFQMR